MMKPGPRDPEDVDVLVVGGGSVGLSAAVLLARQGVTATVVERRPGPSTHPRAAGLNPRTMEIWRAAGLEDAVRASVPARTPGQGVITVPALAGTDLDAAPRTGVVPPTPDGTLALSPAEGSTCAQDRLDAVLRDRAAGMGVDLRYATEATGLTDDADGVTVTLTGPGQTERTVRARYVIAADGVRGPVRRWLGIGADGPGPLGGHMISVLFRAAIPGVSADDPGFAMCVIKQPASPGILIPVDGDRWLFHIAYDPAAGRTPADYPAGRCRDLVRTAIGVADLDVAIDSVLPWESTAQVAERFRAGRVLLAGDAAHVVPPIGGFGLNAGIADAANLAWKLALVLRGAAGEALLDSYAAERRPVARLLMEQSLVRARNHELHWDLRPERAADRRRAGMAGLAALTFGYRYASGAVVGAPPPVPLEDDPMLDGAPGTRLPHAWVRGNDGALLSTLDLPADGFAVLTGPDGAAWYAAARRASEGLGMPITTWRIGADVADPDGWGRAVGLAAGGAVLVRPDGFIGWRSPSVPGDPDAALIAALDRLLARPPGTPEPFGQVRDAAVR